MSTELEDVVNGLGKHFKRLGIEFLIVGARARDIISQEAGLPLSPRRTADVDFGLFVDSWEILDSMRNQFKQDPDIKLNNYPKNKVRYYYKETPFDLVPFGGVAKEGKVSWAPFYDSIMTIIGFEEALANARIIRIGNIDIKVVTPEMLVALKMVAWNENSSRQKDAQDIHYIISNYEQIDRDAYICVLDNHLDILEYFDHDSELASTALIGIRIAKFTGQEHVALIKKVLENSERKEKLARDMITLIGTAEDQKEEQNIKILDALLYGLSYPI